MSSSPDEEVPILHNGSSQNAADSEPAVSKRREMLTIGSLLFAQLLISCFSYASTPFLPYEGKKRGLTSIQVGIIIASDKLARLITSPFCDAIMTQLKPRRSLVLGSIVCAIAVICFGLAGYTEGWTMFILSILFKLLSGSGVALNYVATSSIILQSKSFSTAKLFGWMDMIVTLSLLVGYAVGGSVYKVLGYVMTFVALGIFSIICTIPLWFITPDITADESEQHEGFLRTLMIPGVTMLFLCTTLADMGMASTNAMLSGWLIDVYHIAADDVSFLYMALPVMYTLATPISIWTTEKGWKYSPIIISLLCLTVTYFILCPSPILELILPPQYKNPLWMTICLFGLIGAAVPFIYMPVFQIALDSVTKSGLDCENLHILANLSAVFNSGFSTGVLVGPPLSGAITQTLGYPWNETVIACLIAVLLVIFSIYACITECRTVSSVQQEGDNPQQEEDNPNQYLLSQEPK